jgi:hypothetical protein
MPSKAKQARKRGLASKRLVDIITPGGLSASVGARGGRGSGAERGKLSRGVAAESAYSARGAAGPLPAEDYDVAGWQSWGISRRDVVETLRLTRGLLLRVGWAPRCSAVDACGGDPWESGLPVAAYSLAMALKRAHSKQAHGGAATDALRELVGEPVAHWEDRPLRTRADVIGLIDLAILRLGGAPPRRGGWRVTSHPGGNT